MMPLSQCDDGIAVKHINTKCQVQRKAILSTSSVITVIAQVESERLLARPLLTNCWLDSSSRTSKQSYLRCLRSVDILIQSSVFRNESISQCLKLKVAIVTDYRIRHFHLKIIILLMIKSRNYEKLSHKYKKRYRNYEILLPKFFYSVNTTRFWRTSF